MAIPINRPVSAGHANRHRPARRFTAREREVILSCLIAQECNDGDARPWGSSNDAELTDAERDRMDAAMLSAIRKIQSL